ncbi:MAG: hypothetical protein JO257_20815, partial [Deltaproteobacteria bacterium]|nr:hypothetical protein [Deltaproteobacteria bacterium]
MARDQKTDLKRPEADVPALEGPIETAGADTQFVQSGKIPPVDTTAGKPAPSASDRAYGKGMQALEAMLAKGAPKPKDVATLIDAHRDEHDQMLSLVQQKLGDSFVANVRSELSSLRLSIANKELAVGDPGDPNADYLDISQAQGGAKWKAAGGKETGTIDKNGLDTTAKLNAHDSIHAQVKPDKSGSVDWNRDGKTEATLAGQFKDGKNYDASLSREQDVAGAQVTEGIKHEVSDGKANDSVYADLTKGDTTAHADIGTGGQHLSASTKTAHDSLSGSLAHDATGVSGEIKDTHQFGKNTSVTGDVQRDAAGKWTETVDATHDFGKGTTGTAQVKNADGQWSENASLTHKGAHDQESLSVAHDSKGTTGSLTGNYENGGMKLDGSVSREADAWKLHAGASEQINKQLSVEGHYNETIPDHGKHQSVLGATEKYNDGKVIQSMTLEGGQGAKDYFKATGSVDAQLAPNLYGSAWGSYSSDFGHQ